jgi:DNA-binding NarL/FixJ family response regulator
MPNVDGFGVLEALQGKNIPYPIIAFSTINQRGIILKVIQLGVKSYLVKPLRPEDIFIKALEIFRANC